MEDSRVEIMLDKPRHLLLNLNAMVDFEKATGKNAWKLDENINATDLRSLLWACLRHEDELLTQHDVGLMIHPGNMAEVARKITTMFNKAMPVNDKEKVADPLG